MKLYLYVLVEYVQRVLLYLKRRSCVAAHVSITMVSYEAIQLTCVPRMLNANLFHSLLKVNSRVCMVKVTHHMALAQARLFSLSIQEFELSSFIMPCDVPFSFRSRKRIRKDIILVFANSHMLASNPIFRFLGDRLVMSCTSCQSLEWASGGPE